MATSPDPTRFQPHNARAKLHAALDLLWALHGRAAAPEGQEDLLATLIETILSQSTTNINSARAFESLLDRFAGDWGAMREAPVEAVIDAIRCGGLARQKAPRIQQILRLLHEQGHPDLEHLRALPHHEALRALLALPGVGPKTARFVLMWGAGAPLFAMDTHILRILKRLTILPAQCTNARAHEWIEPLLDADSHWAAHIVLIEHGRTICHAQRPECGRCPLQKLCAAAPLPPPQP